MGDSVTFNAQNAQRAILAALLETSWGVAKTYELLLSSTTCESYEDLSTNRDSECVRLCECAVVRTTIQKKERVTHSQPSHLEPRPQRDRSELDLVHRPDAFRSLLFLDAAWVLAAGRRGPQPNPESDRTRGRSVEHGGPQTGGTLVFFFVFSRLNVFSLLLCLFPLSGCTHRPNGMQVSNGSLIQPLRQVLSYGDFTEFGLRWHLAFYKLQQAANLLQTGRWNDSLIVATSAQFDSERYAGDCRLSCSCASHAHVFVCQLLSDISFAG